MNFFFYWFNLLEFIKISICILKEFGLVLVPESRDAMLNQIVLVGRLTKDVQVNKSEKGKQVASLTLAIPRSFKNMNGTYDTDFIECTIFDNIAQNTSEYCHKGDILGVKGRVQSRLVEKDNEKRNVIEVIAEKVTFLTSKKEEVAEETEE